MAIHRLGVDVTSAGTSIRRAGRITSDMEMKMGKLTGQQDLSRTVKSTLGGSADVHLPCDTPLIPHAQRCQR